MVCRERDRRAAVRRCNGTSAVLYGDQVRATAERCAKTGQTAVPGGGPAIARRLRLDSARGLH